jgi:SAM-dependent methyltransferase
MFSASAEYDDLIYAALKDYAAETAQIATLLRRVNPQCRTVLDVACGTGEHTRRLAAEGFTVDGLDIEPAFVRIAGGKHQAGRFFEADMSNVHLPYRHNDIVDATGARHTREVHELTGRGMFIARVAA